MAFIDPGSLLQDLRFGARMLRRHLLFTVTTALSVGIGIGVDTSVFSVADAVLFRKPTGVAAPERLVDISQVGEGGSIIGFFAYPTYVNVAERVTTFDGLYGHDLVPKPMSHAGARRGDRSRVAARRTSRRFCRPTSGFLCQSRERGGTR